MSLLTRSLRLVRGFARDRRAMGAVEFAMVAPFLLVVYLGGSQLSMALTINRKVQHTASTIADLVTQSETLSKSGIQGIFNVATSIIAPYDISPLKIRVTSVKIDDTGKQTVEWDYPAKDSGLPALTKGASYSLPTGFAPLRSRSIIVAQTKYLYKPVAGYAATGDIAMGGTTYLNPRNGPDVKCSDC